LLGISRFALQRKLDKYGIGKTRSRNGDEDGADEDSDEPHLDEAAEA